MFLWIDWSPVFCLSELHDIITPGRIDETHERHHGNVEFQLDPLGSEKSKHFTVNTRSDDEFETDNFIEFSLQKNTLELVLEVRSILRDKVVLGLPLSLKIYNGKHFNFRKLWPNENKIFMLQEKDRYLQFTSWTI